MASTRGTGREPGGGELNRSQPEVTGPSAEVVRLSNRAAALTFLTAFAFIMAAVTFPTVAADGASALVRVAAVVPMLAAVGAAAWVWRVRVNLRLARQRHAPPPSADSPLQRAAPSMRSTAEGAIGPRIAASGRASEDRS
jgi:hypothetical protein